jgi:hypothetical protein
MNIEAGDHFLCDFAHVCGEITSYFLKEIMLCKIIIIALVKLYYRDGGGL